MSAATGSKAFRRFGGEPPFKVGAKQLYLPSHVVTFLRPKPGQSAMMATFEVPLKFTKLDFRDYLYHLYGVEVTAVRAFINQRMPAQRSSEGRGGGPWYRPRSQKLMIVDLVKPFTWPARPAADAMEPWDHTMFQSMQADSKEDFEDSEARGSWGPQKMRTDAAMPPERRELRRLAQRLLAGKMLWTREAGVGG